ncbi:hypothetical protein AAFF_G00348320 [Aldrovandia affinis]|uniref:Armadillo repeat-containing protein 6 n=1 Tax=Aldrovandia affinis TaxID=143900 RepID=A0AAD7R5J0_9TELE|nr:hypothetical protein AAFF_G00348320 [Aldrovandia affinis]
MAARRITQETFDAVVQENIDEFDMDAVEALNEAVQQFESQGVDLSNIVKVTHGKSDEQTHEVLQALECLRSPAGSSRLAEDLQRFAERCRQDFAQRHLAAQRDAYPTVLSCWRRAGDERGALLATLGAMAALTDGQPDLLDAEGRGLLTEALGPRGDDAGLTQLAARVIRHCCLRHEQNRQDMVAAGALRLLTAALARHRGDAELVREVSAALRVMTLDDDIRVPFGHAHDHAKTIVLEHHGLKIIIEAANAHPGNPGVLSELCATLSRLAVRNEFCQDIVDLGGLSFMMDLLADGLDHQDLVRQVLSALRAVAGNDDVKDAIVKAGGVELIVMAMNRHMGNAQVCEQGCAAMSVLALRKPENCSVVMDTGGAHTALQAMKTHPAQLNVQKQACMLLRNLVSHMQSFAQPILEMGAEALIGRALLSHQDCGDMCRAALRTWAASCQPRSALAPFRLQTVGAEGAPGFTVLRGNQLTRDPGGGANMASGPLLQTFPP